jgi:hypothetical protein
MKRIRFNKGKVVVLFSTSIFIGLGSFQMESKILGISAPTLFFTEFTLKKAAEKFALSKEEKDFVKFAKLQPQTQKTNPSYSP